MKTIIAIILTLSSLTALAKSPCDNARNQADANLCAYEQLDAASSSLLLAVEKKCMKDPEVRAMRGGSGYGVVLAGCQTQILKSLKKQIK